MFSELRETRQISRSKYVDYLFGSENIILTNPRIVHVICKRRTSQSHIWNAIGVTFSEV